MHSVCSPNITAAGLVLGDDQCNQGGMVLVVVKRKCDKAPKGLQRREMTEVESLFGVADARIGVVQCG